VPIKEIAGAKIDLRKNREQGGFVPGKGFGMLTLCLIDGSECHVSMEAGSAAEATLRVITELIRNR